MVNDGVGVLPSVFFELLREIVRKTANSLLGEWRSNGRDGLVSGWPKLAGGKIRVATLSSSKAGETWQWQHYRRVSLFIAQRNATVIPTY
jgi:hypothetical protein